MRRAALSLLCCLSLLAGCASRPPLPSVAQFHTLDSDPRVRYEAGAEAFAARVSAALPQSVRQVELTHDREFDGPIEIYVCGSAACFAQYVATPQLSGATMHGNRVFLAPQLNEREAHRLEGLLTHELSHLHLSQQIGHYTPAAPVWFHEGLAALAAEGGGAEYASDAQATQAIRQGRMFAPEQRDAVGRRHTAPYWGLDIHTFYRQSLLFMRHLREQSTMGFRDFLHAVQDREDFDLAFGNAYNMSLQEAGTRFRQSLSISQLTSTLSE